MFCSDVMKELVQVVSPDASIAEAAQYMRDAGVGYLPVCRSDRRVVGVITDRDIAIRGCAEHRSSEATPVSEIMTEQVVSCSPDDLLECAEREMIHEGVSRVMILDAAGRLAGVITIVDLAHYEDPLAAARVLRLSTSREFRLSGLPGRRSVTSMLPVERDFNWSSLTALHPGTLMS